MTLKTQIKYSDLENVKKQISNNDCYLISCVKIGKYASIIVGGKDVSNLNI